MIRSLTGFGRAEGVVKEKKVSVEVRSLNSRQMDLLLKLPSSYREKEAELRQWAGERIVRGKSELAVYAETLHAQKRTSFDPELVAGYYQELKALSARVDPNAATDLMGIVLRLPDVALTARETLDEAEWSGVMVLIAQAMHAFDAFRASEGARMHDDLLQRTKHISTLLEEVDLLDRDRAVRTRDKLEARLKELTVSVDRDRFEQELIYYLEKLDFNEEKVRLRSHCELFTQSLDADEQQGRKLGFIAQEMGREINTLGSKANDAAIQRLVVMMKDELEKIKEQLPNVL